MWNPVIGLEIHVQLNTNSKIFSSASTNFGAKQNTQACAIDLGMPGVLPVLNEEAVIMAIKFGLAIGADISNNSIFARKNYFYPDLPKGYQISQYEIPIVSGGSMDIVINDKIKKINITRAHLEEDAGKSIHDLYPNESAIDLNRAGTPLIEIVSEPEMESAKEAVQYLKNIHSLIRYLKISDGNMQEGSFRCDANISLMKSSDKKLGTRAEIKNINSFKFVESAINYEIQRQSTLLDEGGTVVQETRLYDPSKNETRSMRSKEEANDYRYFPDPDLLPVHTSEILEKAKQLVPELPHQKTKRFIDEFSLGEYDASVLSSDKHLAEYFEESAKHSDFKKKIANWVINNVLAVLNEHDLKISQCPVSPSKLAFLVNEIESGKISNNQAKEVFSVIFENSQKDPENVIKDLGFEPADSSEIESMVDEVISKNPEKVAEIKAGNDKLINWLTGQVMKLSKGKANPKIIGDLLRNKIL